MDLSSVTPFGAVVFACFKFIGYLFAFLLLKKIQPAVQGNIWLMAGARALMGIAVGGSLYFAWNAARHRYASFYNFSYEPLPYYLVLSVLRVLVWVAAIYCFSRNAKLTPGKTWPYGVGGSVFSALMDVPAAFLTILVPGAVLFC